MTATAVAKDRTSSIQATLATIEELYKPRRAFGAAEWLELNLTVHQGLRGLQRAVRKQWKSAPRGA